MDPGAQPDGRPASGPLGLTGLSLLLLPGAAAYCECSLGLSREALISLIVVLAGVSASCFCALVVVAVAIIRSQGAPSPGRTDSRRFGVQDSRVDLRSVHVEARLVDREPPALESQGLGAMDSLAQEERRPPRPRGRQAGLNAT